MMAKMTPTVRGDQLVYQDQQNKREHVLVVGTPAWYNWLTTATTFAFTGDSGTFTARKERTGNKRGGWYWKAYRTQHSKHSSLYLGKSEALTLEHLHAVAQALAQASSKDATGEDNPNMTALPTEQVERPFATTTSDLPLLATKFHMPRPRAPLVDRPQLIERLQQAPEHPLTLIAAPAGFGKTTLLSAWLERAPLTAAWVSLDPADNDLTRFWSYTLTALDKAFPGCGATALSLLQSPQPPSMEGILTTVINTLTALPQEIVFVWDDYHLITAPAIHTSVTFLLEHLPPRLHLIIAARADPPLPLARLRTRGQLIELRAADLRFLSEETTAFLTRLSGLTLSSEEITALETRTEGWIAGLQLAALSLHSRTDIPGFIRTFTGSHRYVVDYLVEEVLVHQPEPVQTFLFQTAILERMTGSLCEAVTGNAEGQATLERLEQANLFLVPLDDERRWYRYHHLFADMLQQRLQKRMPDLVPELHRRASAWYEQHGLQAEAVGHALSALDFDRAARLIEQVAATLIWKRGELSTLLRWLEALPEQVMHAHLRLLLDHAWALLWSGQVAALEPHLWAASRVLAASTESRSNVPDLARQTMQGELAAIRAELARQRGDVSGAIELAHEALTALHEDAQWLRGIVSGLLGGAYRLRGDVVAASHAYTETIRASQASGNIPVTLIALGQLAQLQAMQGQLHQATGTYQQALDLATRRGVTTLPALGVALVSMGEVLREWNDLDQAERLLHQGIEYCQQRGGLAEFALDGFLSLARILEARGEMDGALRMIQQAEQIGRNSHSAARVATAQAKLWLAQGNAPAATRWAATLPHELNEGSELAYEHLDGYIVLARLTMVRGDLMEAIRLLGRLLQMAESAGLTGQVIEVLVLQALSFQAQASPPQAMMALTRALELAEPQGYVRTFVDEGEPMLALLHHAGSRGVAPDYLDKLLAAFGTTAQVPSPMAAVLIDPLSEREREILRLIAAGLSTDEIADELVIVVGTVRNHIKHIYNKLDAHSRLQAVERARTLNLL
jgi:LuxR family maltose regulon positive regulatory protein